MLDTTRGWLVPSAPMTAPRGGWRMYLEQAAAASDLPTSAARQLLRDLTRASRAAGCDYERGALDGLAAVVEQLAAFETAGGLAPQAAALEPGSLPARLLLEIAAGVRGANADLADRLDTGASQLSRAGRRLREAGLATRHREGRLNGWSITERGRNEARRLRSRHIG